MELSDVVTELERLLNALNQIEDNSTDDLTRWRAIEMSYLIGSAIDEATAEYVLPNNPTTTAE